MRCRFLCYVIFYVLIVYSEKKMVSKRDVHSYFSAKVNESKRSRISIPGIIITATDNASQADVDMAKEEVKKESATRQ